MWLKTFVTFSLPERDTFSVVNVRENKTGYGSLSDAVTSEINSIM